MTAEDLIGLAGTPYRFVVEEGKAAEFAKAVRAEGAVYHDSAAAAEQGLSGVLTAPTFSVASAHWASADTHPKLDLDLRRVLAGGGEWEYLAPILVGDVLEAQVSVANVTRKESSRGPMTIIEVQTEYTRDGEVVQRYTSTILQFDAKGDEK